MIAFTRSGNGAAPWCDFAPHASGWMAVWNELANGESNGLFRLAEAERR